MTGDRLVAGLFAFVLAMGCIIAAARAAPRYYDEQLLNYRFTEYCAEVKAPPKILIQLLNEMIPQNPQLVQAGRWVNDIIEGRAKRKCDDA